MARASRTPRRPARAAGDAERGFVLVWFAILLVVLLGFAALAVDVWHWNHEGARMQRAADAAALGGAVFMPENPGQIAYTTAKQITAKNGYANGVSGVQIDTRPGLRPNQLKVTVSKPVKNFFGSVLGIGSTTIVKHAVAEYERSVNMGSPINQFGNDPELGTIVHGSTRYPDFWANVFGPRSSKAKGDAVLATLCGSGTDNCSGSTNVDHDPMGYFYGVEVAPGAVGSLAVQAFDPAFAHVGDNCGNNNGGSNLIGASQLPPNFNPSFPVANPSVRYDPASSSVYCSGDMYYADGTDNGIPPWTVYQVREPDDTPNDPTNNPVVCQVEFPGHTGNLVPSLQSTTAPAGAPDLFVRYFRQWFTICTVANPQSGTYFVQVQTKTKLNGDAAPYGGGANRFALRAGLGGNFTSTNLRIFGEARIGIYANAPSANTTFYLARVLPGARGRSLVVTFFDTGDAAQAGALTVLPPPDATTTNGAPLTSWAGCTYTAPPGTSSGPPFGTFTATQANCRINGVSSANYNGQWVQVKVPIPDDYDCTFTDATGCWARINFAFPANVNDTTTWVARIEGDPVRLVE
ncbi:MAG: hypothetical protein AMXMBFR46_03110 [Acidimicrobiia bacterium]